MDPLTDAYLAHMESEHRRARYLADMPALASALGVTLLEGEHSLAAGNTVQVQRSAPRLRQRSEIAHELVHVLADRARLTEAVRYQHASAPNIDDHIEALTDHGSDRLLMPKHLVEEVLGEYGDSAQGLWALPSAAEVRIEQAMRRWVYMKPGRRAAFLLSKNYIYYALSSYWVPVWVGSRLDVDAFVEEGGTVYQPDAARASAVACLVVME